MLSLQYGLVAAFSTMCGGLLVIFARQWSLTNRDYVLAFAAGVLVSLSFLKIIPGVFPHSTWGPLALLAGFFAMYLFEQLGVHHHVHTEEVEHDVRHGLTWVAWFGLLAHSFIDGLAIGSSALIEDVGLLQSVTFGVVLHQFPEGLVAAALMTSQRFSALRTLALTAVVAFATPVGAVLTAYFLGMMSPDVLKEISTLVMALAAGTFIYLGAADMLHHSHSQRNKGGVIAFSAGLVLFVLIDLLIH